MKIRNLTYFDYKKFKKMVSYISDDGNIYFAQSLLKEPISFLNSFLPLSMKFCPESFILIDNNEILGLITVRTVPGNHYKISITKLVFKDNNYEYGKQLIDYVVYKYGKKGATSFIVSVDSCHDELFNLFINSCGFRKCASETLWKPKNFSYEESNLNVRYSQNSDAKKLADFYNSEIKEIYRVSLSRTPSEFKDSLFYGFNDCYKTRFLVESQENIIGYLSITTADNSNYIFDITTNNAYNLDYTPIIHFLFSDVSTKGSNFHPFIKLKKYTNESTRLEDYLVKHDFTEIQNLQILVKDFHKPIKETNVSSWNVFILSENQIG